VRHSLSQMLEQHLWYSKHENEAVLPPLGTPIGILNHLPVGVDLYCHQFATAWSPVRL
jgi:hypothetical protein